MRTLIAIAASLLLAGSTYAEDETKVPADDAPADSAPADHAPAAKAPSAKISALAYLTGTWEGAMGGGMFRAQYGAPSKDTLLSYSRLIRANETSFYEFEVFEEINGTLVLTPHPGGNPSSVFNLTSIDVAKQTAAFEDPENDFPSRIEYTRSKNTLTIKLTAPHHKSDKQQTFTLKLVK